VLQEGGRFSRNALRYASACASPHCWRGGRIKPVIAHPLRRYMAPCSSRGGRRRRGHGDVFLTRHLEEHNCLLSLAAAEKSIMRAWLRAVLFYSAHQALLAGGREINSKATLSGISARCSPACFLPFCSARRWLPGRTSISLAIFRSADRQIKHISATLDAESPVASARGSVWRTGERTWRLAVNLGAGWTITNTS